MLSVVSLSIPYACGGIWVGMDPVYRNWYIQKKHYSFGGKHPLCAGPPISPRLPRETRMNLELSFGNAGPSSQANLYKSCKNPRSSMTTNKAFIRTYQKVSASIRLGTDWVSVGPLSHALNPASCGKKGGGHENLRVCKTLRCVSQRKLAWKQNTGIPTRKLALWPRKWCVSGDVINSLRPCEIRPF